MYLKDFKERIKIRWNDFQVVIDDSSWDASIKFNIKPDDFLVFAKDDYKIMDKKGLVGALSNSKRAIDCQVDWIISYLGYDYLNFNDSKYPEIKLLIDEFESNLKIHKNSSIKLRFIQALEIAPIFLISQIRIIRNKLEHEYVLPNSNEVREAIEVAELFINATQNIIINKFSTDVYIGNHYDEKTWTWTSPHLEISFNPFHKESNRINITYIDEKKFKTELKATDKGYVYFIKSAITQDFSYLVKAFNYEIDKKYVKYIFKFME
ncbi:TPA: hypothetical protein LA460_002387 [Clostridium botulinum]|uniref:hypothetical protein n=1 Tax=Clostridium botulinum TaxID=1491 RepID=UPI000774B854|nr:hypothetical protein [Clostridium botulinum]NFL39748.1 hypothetical protein [Clostridium botulinum]NFL66704.1 hypothetical protein [Clostridium botulinum]NFN09613.1 hypothetical protein [Clostridium botulinum]NFN25971.1 hypothetical protein [Clostridium botulinum]NFN30665.1 hypothetical protein [Clostridium botulinum]